MKLEEAQEIKNDPDQWPEPTIDEPDDLSSFASTVQATDGCQVEPDGVCPHGHVSWLLYKGLI